jgi:hypothetical protein|tara:strand:+ start:715 stop:999 length:285 start_codon:yes stop_codon:yes gene_type:complete
MDYKVELEEIDRQLTIRIDRTLARISELKHDATNHSGEVGKHLTAYGSKITYYEGMVEAYNDIRMMYRHQYGYYHIDGSVKGYIGDLRIKEVDA